MTSTPERWLALATLLAVAAHCAGEQLLTLVQPQPAPATAPAHHSLTARHQLEHPRAPPVVIVAAHRDLHRTNLTWLTQQTKFPFVVYTKSPEAAAQNPAYRLLELDVGAEAQAYLTYIIDEYHRLPDTVVMTHGHEHAWHHPKHPGTDSPKSLLETLESLGDLSKISFLTLNKLHWNSFEFKDGSLPQRFAGFNTPGDGTPNSLHGKADVHVNLETPVTLTPKDFEQILGTPPAHIPPYYVSACCGQFIVSRSLIQSRSRKQWRAILHRIFLFTDPSRHSMEMTYKLEWLFFFMFTGLFDEDRFITDRVYNQTWQQHQHNRLTP